MLGSTGNTATEARRMYELLGQAMGELDAHRKYCMLINGSQDYSDDDRLAWGDAAVLIGKAISLLDEASAAIPPRS